MTMMKKEYIRPEQEVLIIDTKASILLITSNENEGGISGEEGEAGDDELPGRNDFSRPGSGNVWNEGW